MNKLTSLYSGIQNHFRSLLLVILTISNLSSFGQAREEFNGPMPSWANVKTRFKAKGDGQQDDTRALQRALDSLTCQSVRFNTGDKAYTVIYLPKGRYKISQTLALKGKIGVNIIGEDPENTIIEWHGGEKDTMLWTNGSAYFRIARITWQGNGKSDLEGIGIHWLERWNTTTSRSFASLNIEIADCIFKGLAIGIGGGYQWNDSEIKINRCHFYECTRAGIEIWGHNALDYWVWHCRFINCYQGIYNSRGNYHVYNSYFKGSKYSDVVNSNGYYTSVRGCFSEGSKAFSIDAGNSSNPFKRIFQDNIVKQPEQLPIRYYHTGKPVLWGNKIDKTTSDTTGKRLARGIKVTTDMLPYALSYASWAPIMHTVLSIDNDYYYKNPFRVAVNKGTPTKHYIINDRHGKSVNAEGEVYLKSMPSWPAYVKRPILSVPRGAGTDKIQAIINQAARLKGQRPIVHFPYGTYLLKSTIYIPAGSDMQIVGDGMRYSSTIRAENPRLFKGKCLIKVAGPSTIEIRDIQLGFATTKNLTAIEFDNVDQRGSFVHLDQIYSACDTTLFVNKIDYTVFEKNNSFFSDGNLIIGGKRQKEGKGTMRVHCFGGSYSRLTVRNNATFISKDCWWEGVVPVPLNLAGDGIISIDGTKIAPNQADSMPIVNIRQFSGKIALMNAYIQGGLQLSRTNPSLEFLLCNVHFYYKKDIMGTLPSGFSGKAAYVGLTTQCFNTADPDCGSIKFFEDRFVNVKDELSFIEKMTAMSRTARPVLYQELPKGVTNIYLSRVTLDSFITGLHFEQ
jgi:hypothetical protein